MAPIRKGMSFSFANMPSNGSCAFVVAILSQTGEFELDLPAMVLRLQ